MSKSNYTAPCAVFSRQNAENSKAADLYILGSLPDIDWDTWSLINTDQEFIQEFKALESDYDRINILINSPGGIITDGLAMYNTIKSSKKDIHTYNLGLAASMGSVLLLAGKTVHAPASSITMIHSAWGGVYGNKNDIRDYADMLEVYESAIIKTVAKKLGKSEEDVTAQYFDGKDHFMTGDDAHKIGLVDVLEEYEADVPDNITNMTYEEIVNHYSNNHNSESMAILNPFASRKEGDETIKVKASELKQLEEDAKAAVTQIDTLEKGKNELDTQVKNLQAEKKAAEDAKAKAEKELADEKAALAAEQKAHQATKAAFEAFKKEPGAEHTTADHREDTITGAPTEPESRIRKDEAAARAQGEKIHAKIKKQ